MNLSGTDRDIVLSSRIRLARNVQGYKFSPAQSPEELAELESLLCKEITSNPLFKDFSFFPINELDELDRIVLKENKIISERYYRSGKGLVITNSAKQTSIVTGDLDHIRISAIHEGLSINHALQDVLSIEKALSRTFKFSSTEDEGYLTVNIADSGTGMKGSVFLHLPVLSASEEMDHLIINTIETMLEVTGFSGGGAHSLGGLYIISNKNGFFPDVLSLAELIRNATGVFIESEREAREDLVNGKYPALEDKIFRAYGTLKYCRQISELEAISALSMIRLGISVNWIDNLTIEDISEISASIGNGFIRSFAYVSNPDETDIMRLRADTIRRKLNLK